MLRTVRIDVKVEVDKISDIADEDLLEMLPLGGYGGMEVIETSACIVDREESEILLDALVERIKDTCGESADSAMMESGNQYFMRTVRLAVRLADEADVRDPAGNPYVGYWIEHVARPLLAGQLQVGS